jgi:hypothetical protein
MKKTKKGSAGKTRKAGGKGGHLPIYFTDLRLVHHTVTCSGVMFKCKPTPCEGSHLNKKSDLTHQK